ncbi:hypothetical protein [Nocardia transvalensis]|uniref:hypothetical protein n=1 Tax=Nocardia transvalensis TaxID=37333 RepID=UPI001893B40D|nr:hypothetical protein [Nocardia transvalensis]MBF6332462.1 hypothetical protein [Nocardia transvalensis]
MKKPPVPTITGDDIVGSAEQVNTVVVLTVRYGVKLRLNLRVDSHIGQSQFAVDVFDHVGRVWAQLWSIPPHTYRIAQDQGPVAAVDPATNLIATPYTEDADLKAVSWQKIITALVDKADEILG